MKFTTAIENGKLAEAQLLPTLEIRGSNPVLCKFYSMSTIANRLQKKRGLITILKAEGGFHMFVGVRQVRLYFTFKLKHVFNN